MDRLTVGLEWFLNPDHVLLILSIEKGWFKEESLGIEMIEPKKHFDALDEIENGSMDITITEPIHLVQDGVKEQNVIGFARCLHTSGGIIYNKDKNIARPKGLIGKRLQYPGAPDPGGIAMAETMIGADGGTYKEGDITPVNHSFYHTDTLLADGADATTLIFENFEVLEARNRGLDVDYFPLKNYNVPDFCQLIFITMPEVLGTSEVKLKKFLKVVRKAIHCTSHHLESAIETYPTYTQIGVSSQLNKDVIKTTAKCFTNGSSMSSNYYNDLQLWLREVNDVKDMINPTLYFTNQPLSSRYTG